MVKADTPGSSRGEVSGPLLYLVLILNVLLEHREGCAESGEEAVRATPKNRFPAVFLYVVRKLFPDQARSHRLEIVDQAGGSGLWVECYQKVDMISLTIKFE